MMWGKLQGNSICANSKSEHQCGFAGGIRFLVRKSHSTEHRAHHAGRSRNIERPHLDPAERRRVGGRGRRPGPHPHRPLLLRWSPYYSGLFRLFQKFSFSIFGRLVFLWVLVGL